MKKRCKPRLKCRRITATSIFAPSASEKKNRRCNTSKNIQSMISIIGVSIVSLQNPYNCGIEMQITSIPKPESLGNIWAHLGVTNRRWKVVMKFSQIQSSSMFLSGQLWEVLGVNLTAYAPNPISSGKWILIDISWLVMIPWSFSKVPNKRVRFSSSMVGKKETKAQSLSRLLG